MKKRNQMEPSPASAAAHNRASTAHDTDERASAVELQRRRIADGVGTKARKPGEILTPDELAVLNESDKEA